MKLLKDRILKDGTIKPGNILKVDSFLNHQMDIALINEIGKEFKCKYRACFGPDCDIYEPYGCISGHE